MLPDTTRSVSLSEVLAAFGFEDKTVAIENKTTAGKYLTEIHCASIGVDAVVGEMKGDVYFSVNPQHLPEGHIGGRSKAHEITDVVALQADLDRKPGAFDSLEDISDFIDEISEVLGTRPRLVTLTGGGVQAIWHMTHCSGERGRPLLRRFGRLIDSAARARKVKLDTVYDLSRVFRVPGTYNHKYGKPRPTTAAIDYTAKALTPDQVDQRLKQAGIHEEETDKAVELGNELCPKDTWQFGEWSQDGVCSYVKEMLLQWETDEPDNGRHQLMVNHLVRIAAAWRLGCFASETELNAATKKVIKRHRQLCVDTGDRRLVSRYETQGALLWAVAHVSRMKHKRVLKELGAHTHPYPAPSQVRAMARRIDKDLALREENLRFWIGSSDSPTASSFPVQWTGSRYRYLTTDGVKDLMWDIIETARFEKVVTVPGTQTTTTESKPWPQSPSAVSGLVQALHGVAKMPAGIEPNSWIGGDGTGLVIPFRNVLFNPADKTTREHSSDFFNLTCLPFDYDPLAKCPLWLDTLKQWWPDDDEAVQLLQEWFGYVISGRVELQKMLYIRGAARSGKGTIRSVLEHLLGEDAVGSLVMSDLVGERGRFALQEHLRSSLIVFPDVRQQSANEGTAFVQRALEITGLDPIQVDIKNQAPWKGKLPARLMVMSNETTSLPDAAGAMAVRLLTLNMPRSFKGKEDPGLQGKLEKELPGILNWALEGLERLDQRGKFVQPESGLVVKADIDDSSNPINTFLRQYVVAGKDRRTPMELVYEKWCAYCQANGEKPGTSRHFRKLLSAAMEDKHPDAEYKYDQIDGGKAKHRPYYLWGIGLRGHKVEKRVVNPSKSNEYTLLITEPQLTTNVGDENRGPA